MDELEKGLDIAVNGAIADEAIRRMGSQIAEWGLAMPEVEPLVLDFGLGDFDRIGEIEYWIANEVDAGYCGKFLFVFEGQTCPLHMHKGKLETFYVVRGRLAIVYGGQSLELPRGGVLRVDTRVEHSFRGVEATLLLEVSKPSIINDNYFADSRIPIGGNYNP